jgi:hypothetical protein
VEAPPRDRGNEEHQCGNGKFALADLVADIPQGSYGRFRGHVKLQGCSELSESQLLPSGHLCGYSSLATRLPVYGRLRAKQAIFGGEFVREWRQGVPVERRDDSLITGANPGGAIGSLAENVVLIYAA